MGLHYRRIAVNIHHQARQSVAFAVYETVTIGLRSADQSHGPPHRQRGAQLLQPPPLVDLLPDEGKHPYRNGTDLVMASGQELALPRTHVHHIALGRLALHPVDSPRKDPRMFAAERLLLAAFQEYSRHLGSFINLLYISRHTHASVAAYPTCAPVRLTASQLLNR